MKPAFPFLCLVLGLAACGNDENLPAPQAATETVTQIDGGGRDSEYWGIEPGEPVPIRWEELMPEGAIEELFRQQDEFYADLDRRLAANATRLSDAASAQQIEEGSDLDAMPQLGTFDGVEELDGELIRIPGYVVPFDFESDDTYTEFLFVPSLGACIHTPPPPPNQVIYVRSDSEMRVPDIWVPYWLEGELTIERNENDLGDAAYALNLSDIEPFPIPQ